MKKLLILLSSITLIGTGSLGAIQANSNVSSPKLQNQKLATYGAAEDIDRILQENIDALQAIEEEIVLDALVQFKNNVIMDYKMLADQGLTQDFLELVRRFELANITIAEVAELFFGSEHINPFGSGEYIFGWQIAFKTPETWYEWILGIWSLEFNHKLSQDMGFAIVSTAIILREIADFVYNVPGFANKVPSFIKNMTKFLLFGSNEVVEADQGNGVAVKFVTWIVPTDITPSTYDWE